MTHPPRWEVPAPDPELREAAVRHQARLIKPTGSLGRLEDLAVDLAAWQGQLRPRARPAAAVLFAADHPVARHGVSAYPPSVTRAMVGALLGGGAAASVAARALRIPLGVVDVGVVEPDPGWASTEHVAFLSARAQEESDVTVDPAFGAEGPGPTVRAGAAAVDALAGGARVVLLGDLGIGNTTLAAAVACALLGADPEEMVGPGTGVSGQALERKRGVVRAALARSTGSEPWTVLGELGGRELAALVGAMGRALERGAVVLVDGFLVSVAALLLVRMQPGTRAGLLFSHRSAEPGHRRVLEMLQAVPLLELGMRLGEGSGALAAFPIVELACTLATEMATFDDAGVPGRSGS